MKKNDEFRRLAEKLINLWYDFGIWQPIVIAQCCPYTLLINRKGHLCISGHTGDPVSAKWTHKYLSTKLDGESVRDFDEALVCSQCTARDFEKAVNCIWISRPLPVAWYCFVAGKIRRFRHRSEIMNWQKQSAA